MLYQLEKPDISASTKEKVPNLLENPEIQRAITATLEPEYEYWKKVKYLPRPTDVSAEELWACVKFVRTHLMSRSETPIQAESGAYFSWIRLAQFDKALHDIDLQYSGNLTTITQQADEKEKNRLIARGVMEEAISSSQLEGANTSRKVAKQFLREGRKPSSHSEQMILNNYRTMKAIEDTYKEKNMSREMLFELHALLTEKTLDKNEVGRFRTDADEIIVGSVDNVIYHIPPKEKFLIEQITRLIAFANDEDEKEFIHPVIKAILLHFWIGYLHPFADGNGRMARALFYWYVLKHGYRAFAYLPISKMIKSSPGQYQDAYIYSEQDDQDVTYFLDYNMRKIQEAQVDFAAYVEKVSSANASIAAVARKKYQLNERQLQLLRFYLNNKDQTASITMHMRTHQVSRLTAVRDLKELVNLGFLSSQKIGKQLYFSATDKIAELE